MCASVVVMCTVYMEVQMHNLYIALKAKWYGCIIGVSFVY